MGVENTGAGNMTLKHLEKHSSKRGDYIRTAGGSKRAKEDVQS